MLHFIHRWALHRSGNHHDVIKSKFPRYPPFVRGIHLSPVNSPHKGLWRRALMFSLICAWINGSVNNREAGYLRRDHHDVIVMLCFRYDDTYSQILYKSIQNTVLSALLWQHRLCHKLFDLFYITFQIIYVYIICNSVFQKWCNEERLFFLWHQSYEAVEPPVELSLIWDAITLSIMPSLSLGQWIAVWSLECCTSSIKDPLILW